MTTSEFYERMTAVRTVLVGTFPPRRSQMAFLSATFTDAICQEFAIHAMRAIAIAHVVGDATMTPDDVVAWLEAQTTNYRPLCTLVQSEWLSGDRIDTALRSIVSQFAHGLGVLTPTEKANKAKWDRESETMYEVNKNATKGTQRNE